MAPGFFALAMASLFSFWAVEMDVSLVIRGLRRFSAPRKFENHFGDEVRKVRLLGQ